MSAKIHCYVISCSSDSMLDTRKLFIWGEMGMARWLPETMAEAKKRILQCQKESKCESCDAEIHRVVIERTEKTKRQKYRSFE